MCVFSKKRRYGFGSWQISWDHLPLSPGSLGHWWWLRWGWGVHWRIDLSFIVIRASSHELLAYEQESMCHFYCNQLLLYFHSSGLTWSYVPLGRQRHSFALLESRTCFPYNLDLELGKVIESTIRLWGYSVWENICFTCRFPNLKLSSFPFCSLRSNIY